MIIRCDNLVDLGMENSIETRWKALEQFLEGKFGKLPNMEAILFLVGLNEYNGRVPKIKFSKEEKQELMHVGVCAVLEKAGLYEFEGRDEEGWPHYKKIAEHDAEDLSNQELLLKTYLLDYFGY
jgi:hypothetical protein